MLSERQLGMIKTKIIWMRGRPGPDADYVRWWNTQDPFVMEQQARQLRAWQAYGLIAAARTGQWPRVIALWRRYTSR